MRARAAWVLAVIVAPGFGAACTKINPAYFIDAGNVDVTVDGHPDAAPEVAPDAGGDVPPDAPIGCQQDHDCVGDPGGPACDTTTHKCVTCTMDKHCPADAGAPVCDTTAHACVGCLPTPAAENPCTGTSPICDAKAETCRICKSDAECVTAQGANPGVCASDGHCVSPGEVIYGILPTSDCTAPDGSITKPYCRAADAVMAAMTNNKPFVVLRGSFGGFAISSTPTRLTVVGQGGATLNPGSDLYAVDVTGPSSVTVRDLTITGGTAAGAHVKGGVAQPTLTLFNVHINYTTGNGVLAEGGASLVMDRCIVQGGGTSTPPALVTTASPFHIINSVFTASSTGASLDAVPNNGEQVFKNNSLVSNGTGIACLGSFATGLLFSSNSSDKAVGCTPPPCCTGTNLTTSDFHLMSGSPCIDQLPYDPQVPDDIDGDTRPYPAGGMSDCGADEYVPPSP